MSLLTVEGIYKDGKIELSESPGTVESPVRVLVTFFPTAVEPAGAADREAARQRAFARMTEGINLGAPPYPSREELHDRHR